MRHPWLIAILISILLTGQEPVENDSANGYWSRLKQYIRHSIFVPEHKRALNDSLDFIKGEEKFRQFAGRRIATIHIIQAELVTGFVFDTSRAADLKIIRLLNNLHFSTKESVIRNNLLFKENDFVDPYELADTERILRRLSYIEDANIIILPREHDQEMIDCIVIIQDKFSIGFSYDPVTPTIHKFKLYDRNLVGYGFELSNTFVWHSQKDKPYEYDGQVYLHNLQGSFISSLISYKNNYKEKSFTTRFSRGFITPKIKYAGGFELNVVSEFDDLIKKHTFDLGDLWVGRSFQIDSVASRKNLIVAARIGQKKYRFRPPVLPDSNYSYHHNQLMLASLTFRKINYLQTKMVLSFGTTEDIPYGYLLDFTAGVEREEFYNKPYLGTSMAFADYLKGIGYVGFRTELGSFIYNGDFVETLWRSNLTYFTALHSLYNYHLRTVLNASFSAASRRLPHENLYLNDYLRQFSNNEIKGRQRVTLNMEPVFFTPWDLIGFKFAFFTFGDLGFITEDRFLFSEKNLFGSFGFGFRIRNESLVFNTMEIRLAYLMKPRAYNSGWDFHYTSSYPEYIRTIQFSKPRFITYE
jgi:hypothetical protein